MASVIDDRLADGFSGLTRGDCVRRILEEVLDTDSDQQMAEVISVPTGMAEMVDRLFRTGLFGISRKECLARLLGQGISANIHILSGQARIKRGGH